MADPPHLENKTLKNIRIMSAVFAVLFVLAIVYVLVKPYLPKRAPAAPELPKKPIYLPEDFQALDGKTVVVTQHPESPDLPTIGRISSGILWQGAGLFVRVPNTAIKGNHYSIYAIDATSVTFRDADGTPRVARYQVIDRETLRLY